MLKPTLPKKYKEDFFVFEFLRLMYLYWPIWFNHTTIVEIKFNFYRFKLFFRAVLYTF